MKKSATVPGSWLLGLAILFCLAAVTGKGEIVLVEAGVAQAVVLLPENPEPIAEYAAAEWVEHIARATGVRLAVMPEREAADQWPYRVYIGSVAAARDAGIETTDLAPEATHILTKNRSLFIVGRDGPGDPLSPRMSHAGTLWGVYALLESELGVRWLWPGELGTVVPATDRMAVAARDERFSPPFVLRNFRPMTRHNDPRRGFSEEGERTYREAERIFLRRHRMGDNGDPRPRTGHTFAGWWRRYGEQHPEWFSMAADGTRGPSAADRYHQVAMCVSNPDFHDAIIEGWRERRRERPEAARTLSIGEANTWARCACKECEAWDEDPPDMEELAAKGPYVVRSHRPINAGPRYARFWKTIAERVAAIDPETTVTAYVYMNYFAAPREDMRLPPNLVLSFVPWTTWWFPRHDGEQEWVKQQWDRWRALGATLWYRPNYTLDGYTMPHVATRQAADAFRHYAAHGMIGTDFDSLTGQWAAQGPMLYLLLRLHTHPEAEFEELLAEYYRGFGPATEAVRDYFNYWERHTMGLRDTIDEAKRRHRAARFNQYARFAHELFPPDALAEGRRLLDRAAAVLSDGDAAVYHDRIQFLRDGLTHALLCVETAAVFADEDAAAEDRRAALDALGRFRRQVEDRFVAAYHWPGYQERFSWPNLADYYDEAQGPDVP